MNTDCALWHPQQGDYAYNAWAYSQASYSQPSKGFNMVPCDVKAGIQEEKSPRSTAGSSNDSTIEKPVRVQSAARAAKRQRGRERRKMYRAAAHENKCLEEMQKTQSTVFDAHAAAVAKEVKLVVRHTFFDVDSSEESSEEEVIQLPAAIFNSTGEFDEWRRDYRKFRLGHHQGAKGELSPKNFAMEFRCSKNLAGLDLSSSLALCA